MGSNKSVNILISKVYDKLTVIKHHSCNKIGHNQWLCQCECGNTKIMTTSNLNYFAKKSPGKILSCGCTNNREGKNNGRFKDLTGKSFGNLRVLDLVKTKKGKSQWDCLCNCGNRKVIKGESLRSGKTKSCGCFKNRKGIDNPNTRTTSIERYFSKIKNGIIRPTKTLDFNITIYDLENLIIQQNYKCAISGINIELSKNPHIQTASLDRIDSSKGYRKDNIQWVHKKINLMKMNLSQEEFINYCREITNFNNKN